MEDRALALTSNINTRCAAAAGRERVAGADRSLRLIGRSISKKFETGVFCGQVVAYDQDAELYKIKYEDDDSEELTHDELVPLLRRHRRSVDITSPVALAVGTRIQYCFNYGEFGDAWSAATVVSSKEQQQSCWVDVDFDDGGRRTVYLHAGNQNTAWRFAAKSKRKGSGKLLIGSAITKRFGSSGLFSGTIIAYDDVEKLYLVRYLDGDVEELTSNEVLSMLLKEQPQAQPQKIAQLQGRRRQRCGQDSSSKKSYRQRDDLAQQHKEKSSYAKYFGIENESSTDLETEKTIDFSSGERIEYLFNDGKGSTGWCCGSILQLSRWSRWWDVEFDDGKKMCVLIEARCEGKQWRRTTRTGTFLGHELDLVRQLQDWLTKTFIPSDCRITMPASLVEALLTSPNYSPGPRPRVFDPAAHGWVFKETEARPDHGIDGDYWRLTIEHPDGSTDSNSGQCTVPYIRGCGTVQHIKGGTTYVCHSYFLHSDDAKRVSLYHVLKGHPKDDNGASKIMRGTLGGRVDKETDRRAKRQRKARVLPPGFVDTLDPSLSFAMSKSLKAVRPLWGRDLQIRQPTVATASADVQSHDGNGSDETELCGRSGTLSEPAELCCEHCNKPDGAARMVICDGCNTGHHLHCITPPLPAVPTGSWYCHGCTGEHVAKSGNHEPLVWGYERLHTSIFASDMVRQAMKKRTWQRDETDEPLLDKPASRLPIFTKNTGTAKGVGAFAARFLEPDEFIAEYAGEIIRSDDLMRPGRVGSQYVFDLGDGFAIDARPIGNKTRRMNHSSNPNVRARVVNHRGVRANTTDPLKRKKQKIFSGRADTNWRCENDW